MEASTAKKGMWTCDRASSHTCMEAEKENRKQICNSDVLTLFSPVSR